VKSNFKVKYEHVIRQVKETREQIVNKYSLSLHMKRINYKIKYLCYFSVMAKFHPVTFRDKGTM
jgi:hypothetical protein